MGFLDSIFGKGKDNDAPKSSHASVTLLKTSYKFSPLRLTALRDSSVSLVAKVTNHSSQQQLVSIDVELPKNIMVGFDQTVLKKNFEKKVGNLDQGDTKEFAVTIYGSNQTRGGVCPINVIAYSHYLDYDKVIDKKSERLNLRIS